MQGFNSILVRLKVVDNYARRSLGYQFQFHTGSIKSFIYANQQHLLIIRFNSILVRLKAKHANDRRF